MFVESALPILRSVLIAITFLALLARTILLLFTLAILAAIVFALLTIAIVLLIIHRLLHFLPREWGNKPTLGRLVCSAQWDGRNSSRARTLPGRDGSLPLFLGVIRRLYSRLVSDRIRGLAVLTGIAAFGQIGLLKIFPGHHRSFSN